MVCTDSSCPTCKTRLYLKEERKRAQKEGRKLPTILQLPGSSLCRREGSNYTVQCMGCLQAGMDSQYRGESSRSSRQRHKEHARDLEAGTTSSPLVHHVIEVHGGDKTRLSVHNK